MVVSPAAGMAGLKAAGMAGLKPVARGAMARRRAAMAACLRAVIDPRAAVMAVLQAEGTGTDRRERLKAAGMAVLQEVADMADRKAADTVASRAGMAALRATTPTA